MSIEFCGAYSEQETSALKDFLQQRLVKYQYTQAATVANFATICFDIPQEFGRLYPQSVEQVLRALSSGVYLAAMPMNGDIINLQTTWSRLPQLESGQELPFFLAVSSYSCRDDFTRETIRLTGRNYQENFAHLSQAGIPIPRGWDWCQGDRKVIKATFV